MRVGAVVVVLTGLAWLAWPFTVDDAFISARYAQRLAQGAGYTFVAGAPTDGVTGPLWLVPLALAAWLGMSPILVAKLLSAAAGVTSVACVMARAGRRGAADVSVALVCAGSLPLVAWSVAGLETGLATLLATWLALAALDRAGWQLGALTAALAWLRPELAPFAAVCWLMMAVRDTASARRALLLSLLGAASVLAFRALMFGHALPMSLSAKPASLATGASYVLAALREPRAWLLAAALGHAVARGPSRARWLALACIAHALSLMAAGGDWMPARRLFVPVLPTLALSVAWTLRVAWLRRPRGMLVAASLLALLGARELVRELPRMREAGALRERNAPRLARLVCTSRREVALIDVGLVGALCPEVRLLDLGGLTEPAVAHARGVHLDKRIDEAWLRAREPALLLHSRERPRVDSERRLRWFAGYPVERRVLSFDFVRDYRVREVLEYAPSYFYVWLEPPGAPRQ